MAEEESTNRRAGVHGTRFGEFHPSLRFRIEELEEEGLLGVVGLGRVARSGADALVNLLDELGAIELSGTLDAPGDTGSVVKKFREGFCEAVGDGLDHNRFIVVFLGFVFVCKFVRTMNADNEATEVVAAVLAMRRDIVGEGVVGLAF